MDYQCRTEVLEAGGSGNIRTNPEGLGGGFVSCLRLGPEIDKRDSHATRVLGIHLLMSSFFISHKSLKKIVTSGMNNSEFSILLVYSFHQKASRII
jgi:hypothetical protein